MDYKLLVLDIDGTVTNSKKEVTEKTRKTLLELQERGVPVALASGRPPMGIGPIADLLQLDRYESYILGFNGARIINWKTKECIYEKTLPVSMPARILEECRSWGMGMLTYDEKRVIAVTPEDSYMDIEARINRVRLSVEEDLTSFFRKPVNKCLLTGDPDNLAAAEIELAEKYRHEAEVFRSEPYFLEITPKNVDKAYCLSHLLKILGIEREQVVCVGDGYNDISMILYAGLGVAMKNAQEAVKNVADYVTEHDTDQDGVAEVAERFFR